MQSRVVALVTTAALATSGCSVFLVRGPSVTESPPRSYPQCTSAMTWPAVDGSVALLFAIGVAAAIGQSDATYRMGNPDKPPSDQRREASVGFGVFAAIAATSAVFGYMRVKRCDAVRDEFARAFPQGQTAPAWGPPPATYPAPPPPRQGYPQPPPRQGYPQPPQ